MPIVMLLAVTPVLSPPPARAPRRIAPIVRAQGSVTSRRGPHRRSAFRRRIAAMAPSGRMPRVGSITTDRTAERASSPKGISAHTYPGSFGWGRGAAAGRLAAAGEASVVGAPVPATGAPPVETGAEPV